MDMVKILKNPQAENPQGENPSHQGENPSLCQVCFDGQKSVVLLPCRHLGLCEKCADGLTLKIKLRKEHIKRDLNVTSGDVTCDITCDVTSTGSVPSRFLCPFCAQEVSDFLHVYDVN